MPPKTSQWPKLGQLVRSTASKFRQQCSVLSTFSSQIKQAGHQVLFGRKRRFVSAVGKESVVNATSAVAKFEFEAFNWFLLAITRAAAAAAENRNWLHFYCRSFWFTHLFFLQKTSLRCITFEYTPQNLQFNPFGGWWVHSLHQSKKNCNCEAPESNRVWLGTCFT